MSVIETTSNTQRIIVNRSTPSVQVVSVEQRIIVNPPVPPSVILPQPQHIVVQPSAQEVVVETVTQRIVLNPATYSISVINAGPVGPPGPPGAPGTADGEVFRYVHDQTMAATVWVIDHNMDGYPNVTTIEYAGGIIEGDVVYTNSNTITITFSVPVDGFAYLS